MPLKQFRLQIEIVLNINEFTAETAIRTRERDSEFEREIQDPETWKHVARERRFYATLLGNDEVLTEFVSAAGAGVIEDEAACTIRGSYDGVDVEDDILVKIFDQLGPDDCEYFNEVYQAGVLYENLEDVWKCFDWNLVQATMSEVKAAYTESKR